MNHVRKTYVEFLGNTSSKRLILQVKTRDTSKVKARRRYWGFKFFDIFFATVVDVDGEKIHLTSERVKESPNHYWGDELYSSVAEFNRKFPKEPGLMRKIKFGRGKRVVRHKIWGLLILKKTDIFIKQTAPKLASA